MSEPAPVLIAVMPPFPIASMRREVREPAGDWTLADAIEATGLPPADVTVSLDGALVPFVHWDRKPWPGQSVIISTKPRGILVNIAWIAVQIAATAAINYGINRLTQSLIGPSEQSVDEVGPGRRRTIAGENNAFEPYGTIPQVLGRHRRFPPLAARSYTTVEDGALYQYLLFTFGYGELELSELKIGEDPLFKEGTTLAYTGSMLADADKWVLKESGGVVTKSSVEVELRAGTGSDAAITLFSQNVQEQIVARKLRANDGVIQRTVDRATRVTVIVSCDGGLINRKENGKVEEVTVRVAVESRAASSSGAWTPEGTIKLTGKTMSSVHGSLSFDLTEGAYDIRVRRETAEPSPTSGVIDDTHWTSMLVHRAGDVVTVEGLCRVAMKAKITGNFSRPVDQFNAIAQTVAPHWNGSAWVTQATSQNAALYRHVLQGRANKRAIADARINLTKLQAWAVEADAKGFEFNYVTQGRSTVLDVLRMIAAAGRASPGIVDGLFTVVTENPLTGAPVQHFTPRNCRNFREVRRYVTPPQAFKVQFVDPEAGYLDTERIVPFDGYTEATAETFERLDLRGITLPDQAYKLGRYHAADLLLRPSEYHLETDFEHLDCVRGDWVKVAHDVILVGLAQGRVVSVAQNGGGEATSVTLDQQCPMAAASYAIRVRKSDGSTIYAAVNTAAGNQTTLTFTTPLAAGAANQPIAGDLFLFGEAGEEAIDCIVKEIEPAEDLAARLVLVDANAAILTADSGTIPAYDSHVTIPPKINPPKPEKPRVTSVETTSVAPLDNRGGASVAGIRIRYQPSGVKVVA